MELTELDGIGKSTAKLLEEAGVFSVEQLAGLEDGFTVPGISDERLAELQDKALDSIERGGEDEEEDQAFSDQPEEEEAQEEANAQPEEGEAWEPEDETPTAYLYKRLTFREMVGNKDVGELQIRGYLFKVGEPHVVPADEAELILSRTQYVFDEEDVTE